MSSLVHIAAPASKNAMVTADNPSSASAASGGGKEGAFSSHLKAQQDGSQHQGNGLAKERPESGGKSAVATSEAESSGPNEGHDQVASTAADNDSVADSNAGQASSETNTEMLEQLDSLSGNGLQNTRTKGLEDQLKALPLPTMGERVQQELAADKRVKLQPATPVDVLNMPTSGNESPSGDEHLPQVAAAVEGLTESIAEESVGAAAPALALDVNKLEPNLVENSVLAEAAQPIVAAVSPVQTDTSLSRSAPALSNVIPELLRSAQGGEAVVLGEVLDSETDLETDLAVNIGKAPKGSLLESTTPKVPLTPQVVTEVLSNGAGSKDTFEQVRQNIMATLAGKSETASPVNLLVSGGAHEAGEAPTQGINFSSANATLTAAGAESPKYTTTPESTLPRFFTLQTPAGQPGWDVEVGNRIRWMAGQNNTGVELRLNPRELGSIEVKVATEGERTSVTFFAANPAARETLELALPRLREMFADSGMQLANADVSDQGFQQAREQLSGSEGFLAGGDSGEPMILETAPGLAPQGQAEGRSVIDYYI